MRVVTNTSPLVYLFRLGLIDLLRQLYGPIVVPQSVVEELIVGRSEGFDVPDCTIYEWMRVETIRVWIFCDNAISKDHGWLQARRRPES